LPREGQSDPKKCRFAVFSHGLDWLQPVKIRRRMAAVADT
jgi:hypothetical protein